VGERLLEHKITRVCRSLTRAGALSLSFIGQWARDVKELQHLWEPPRSSAAWRAFLLKSGSPSSKSRCVIRRLAPVTHQGEVAGGIHVLRASISPAHARAVSFLQPARDQHCFALDSDPGMYALLYHGVMCRRRWRGCCRSCSRNASAMRSCSDVWLTRIPLCGCEATTCRKCCLCKPACARPLSL
jgi:hypothetical protein